MDDRATDTADFHRVQEILRTRVGKANAITIDDIAIGMGYVRGKTSDGRLIANRRPVEKVLETRLGDFEFLVVSSSSAGVWRPASPDELNECLGEIRRRHRSLQIRDETWCRKGRLHGWSYDGSRFLPAPAQMTLSLS